MGLGPEIRVSEKTYSGSRGQKDPGSATLLIGFICQGFDPAFFKGKKRKAIIGGVQNCLSNSQFSYLQKYLQLLKLFLLLINVFSCLYLLARNIFSQ
jgi:hypothetical protein